MVASLVIAGMVIGAVQLNLRVTAIRNKRRLSRNPAVFIKKEGVEPGIAEIMKPDGKFRRRNCF